jgi:hypothetical protein
LVRSSYLVIDDEFMYVYTADEASKTLTVERGDLGTTPAVHLADTRIECNPRFGKPMLRDALQAEIASWPDTLYATASLSLSVGSSSYSVDAAGLPSDFYDILEVTQQPTSLSTFSTSWPEVGYRIERGMALADFPSGVGLMLNRCGPYTINVVYARPFDVSTFTDETDLVTDVGLEAWMLDIPPLGAAARLLAGREASRSAMEAQGESRAPQEVPMNSTLRSAAGLRAMADDRIVKAGNRLLARYGWRRTA